MQLNVLQIIKISELILLNINNHRKYTDFMTGIYRKLRFHRTEKIIEKFKEKDIYMRCKAQCKYIKE